MDDENEEIEDVAKYRDEVEQYRSALTLLDAELDDLAKMIVAHVTGVGPYQRLCELEDLKRQYRSAITIRDAHAKALVRATDAWGWAITRDRQRQERARR